MSTFPAAGYISNNARTEGEQKTAFEDMLAATKQLPGGQAETTLTIAAGTVTPTRTSHAIDTEASASTDDLATIAQTNLPDGSLLILRNLSAGRAVVLKHSAGGTGQLDLQGNADLTMDDPEDFIMLRRDGTVWLEVFRHRKTDRGVAPRGLIAGYRVSNSTGDLSNDHDIAAGEAASDDASSATRVLLAGSAMTKRLDATWAAGTNQGYRLAADSLVDGTWYVFAFRRSGGAIDYVASLSLTPTLPDGGTHKRLIRAFTRTGGTNRRELQRGDKITFHSPPIVFSGTGSTGSQLVTLTGVPTGLEVTAFGAVAGAGQRVNIQSPDQLDVAPDNDTSPLGYGLINTGDGKRWEADANTSAQVRIRSDAAAALHIQCDGYRWSRGRDD